MILVVGAGFVGAPLVRTLAENGHTVAVASRRAAAGVALAPTIVRHALDVTSASDAALALALAGVSALVMCQSTSGGQDRAQVYVGAAERITRAITLGAAPALARVVVCSSTSALPDRDGLMDEDEAAWPSHTRGQVQRRAEAVWLGATAAIGLPCTILRLAGLYGPGRPLASLYLRDPGAVIEGDAWTETNLVHRDDAVDAVCAALARHPAYRGVLHIADAEHTPRRTMIEEVARASKLVTPRFVDPRPDGPPRGKRVDARRAGHILGWSARRSRAGAREAFDGGGGT